MVVVTSELEPPDLSLATLSSDPDEDVDEARVLTLSLFLRILWTLEASCTEVELSREEQCARTESESRRDLTGEAEEATATAPITDLALNKQ